MQGALDEGGYNRAWNNSLKWWETESLFNYPAKSPIDANISLTSLILHKLPSFFFNLISPLELKKTLESPLDCKEIKPVNPKGNQPWIFTERTVAEAPILWSPDANSRLIGKDPDAGKDWRQEENRAAKDEMVDGITDSMDMNLSKFWEIVKNRRAWHASVHGVTKSLTALSYWTTVHIYCSCTIPTNIKVY